MGKLKTTRVALWLISTIELGVIVHLAARLREVNTIDPVKRNATEDLPRIPPRIQGGASSATSLRPSGPPAWLSAGTMARAAEFTLAG